MGRWPRALVLVGVACTGDPVEAMTGMTAGGGSGSSDDDPLPQTTTGVSADTGSALETESADGSTGMVPATSTTGDDPSTTDEDSTSAGDEDSSTGVVRIGCDALVARESMPAVCSTMASASATLRIVNECETESLEMFWVGYDCSENFWGLIVPGAEWQVQSYVTHPWRIRASSDERLMLDVPPLTGDTDLELP